MTRSLSVKRKALTQLAALAVLIPLSLWAAKPLLQDLDWGEVGVAFSLISPLAWIGAALATLASFAALGRYDVTVHRYLQTGVPDREAQISGACAVALSQFLGLAVVTGTIARWQSSDRMTATQAGSVTALVSVSFMWAWLALLGLSGLVFPSVLPLPTYVFVATLASASLFALYAVLRRRFDVAGHTLRLPSLRALRTMGVFAALDISCAAFAFWLLLPAEAGLSFMQLLPIYVVGLGVALMSNTPGGVGPFEVTLLWALHSIDVNAVLAGVIAFRTMYYAIPAVLAAAYLLWRPRETDQPTCEPTRDDPIDLLNLHPEAGIIRQQGQLLRHPNGQTALCALQSTTQISAALHILPRTAAQVLAPLEDYARKHATDPIAYKLPARGAVAARRKGWTVTRIARDAVLNPQTASTHGRKCAGLRRKLRKAEEAEILCKELGPAAAPWEDMADIDFMWTEAQGGARGFSMGRFSPDYIADQRLFVANHKGRAVAFVTFHHSRTGWALDLVRQAPDAPDGVMHALIWTAVNSARTEGVSHLSLASTPCKSAPFYRALIAAKLMRPTEGDGLAQFKGSFAPRWTPLYAAAPRRDQLLLGLWDIWQEVQNPLPLTSAKGPAPSPRFAQHVPQDNENKRAS